MQSRRTKRYRRGKCHRRLLSRRLFQEGHPSACQALWEPVRFGFPLPFFRLPLALPSAASAASGGTDKKTSAAAPCKKRPLFPKSRYVVVYGALPAVCLHGGACICLVANAQCGRACCFALLSSLFLPSCSARTLSSHLCMRCLVAAPLMLERPLACAACMLTVNATGYRAVFNCSSCTHWILPVFMQYLEAHLTGVMPTKAR